MWAWDPGLTESATSFKALHSLLQWQEWQGGQNEAGGGDKSCLAESNLTHVYTALSLVYRGVVRRGQQRICKTDFLSRVMKQAAVSPDTGYD